MAEQGERISVSFQGQVQDSAELTRILNLPRRVHAPDFVQQLVRDFTSALKRPEGTMSLFPIQAIALYEIHIAGGLLAPIGVGHGKTLISVLAPRILNAKRPLLVVPASLRDKTTDDMEALRRHWFVPPFIRVESYEFLSRVRAAELLTRYQPDAIIADEAHRLKDVSTACTKRVRRYIQENQHCRFIAMSGTLTKRSLQDYAHLSAWALRDLSPLPRQFPVLMEWCGALDEGGAIRTFAPGALKRLEDPSDPVVDQNSARRAFRRRLVETPGVVATEEGSIDTSLEIDHDVVNDPAPATITEAFRDLRDMWVLPDGHEIIDAVEAWRHARELAMGFYYIWDPWPPETWTGPRSAWGKALREILKSNRRQLDTDLQVRQAIEEHPEWYPEATALFEEWKRVRDDFEPNTQPVWLSDDVIYHCAAKVEKLKGILWIEHQAFGERFEQLTKIPCYGQEGRDSHGNRIEHHKKGRPLAALVQSNHAGRNLQAWNTNYIAGPPTSGNIWEQMLGRTHRIGQTADTVYCEVMFGCLEHVNAWNQALSDAEYVENSQGQKQKILYADKTFHADHILTGKKGPIWTKRTSLPR